MFFMFMDMKYSYISEECMTLKSGGYILYSGGSIFC